MAISVETYQALGLSTYKIINTHEIVENSVSMLQISLIPFKNNKVIKKDCQVFHPDVDFIDVLPKNDFLLVYGLDELLKTLEPFKEWYQILLKYEPKIDVRELSRILLPFEEHPLKHTIEQRDSDSINPDSFIAKAFHLCIEEALGLSSQTTKTLQRLSKDFQDGLSIFFQNLNDLMDQKSSLSKNLRRKRPKNMIGEPGLSVPLEKERSLDPDICHQFFKSNGICSQHFSQYEHRKGQEEMAKAVAKAFNRQEFLVAEAGTGIGKSLAYLLPGLSWLTENPGQKMIITTHTKTLQQQLFSKELPFLEKVLPNPFYAVLLKGRSNYLCLKRWETITQYPESSLSQSEKRHLLPLVIWADETGDGDIDMHPSYASDLHYSLWRKLNADSPDCDRSRCPHESVCFLQRIRKAAKQADLVVVNHALLFSDMVSSGSIIGPYSSLIMDEAHQIEKVASNHLGVRLQPRLFKDLVQSCAPARGTQKNLFSIFHSKAAELQEDAFQKLEKFIHTIQHHAETVQQCSNLLFNQLKIVIIEESESANTKVRLTQSPFNESLLESYEALDENLCSLEWTISQCAKWIQDESFRTLDDIVFECGRLMDQVEQIKNILRHFLNADYEEYIIWQETNSERDDRDVILQSVPLQIGQILAEKLYPKLSRCLFTSATLSVAGEFDYLVRQLGLDQIDPECLSTRLFESPFLYNEQVLMGIPTFIPSPKESNYINAASDLIKEILEVHPRGTLVLFTSNAMLRSTYTRVKESIANIDHLLMAQGIDGNRDQLLNRFRTDQNSILFGTSSFWEGIDVPGAALETLIITRIPFDVPTDPIVQARTEYVQKMTGNGFINYTLPEAIIRLRQGFGRLIRSSQDRGLMLLLDMRVLKNHYGRLILDSLPVQSRIFSTENELFDAINTWFHTEQ
ncbi:hypothetical protein HQ585_21440 [candidate division KSB1 bacterium]|nr:hypothetical protein [candidate division KSB1 bacterium]